MRKLKYIWMAVLVSISSLANGQGDPSMLDPNIRYGVLENGMTYYLLHNEEPKERASFYIVHNVGAVLEEDDQDGLAHMLEHMAFNGSANFKGKGVKNFLERQGVEFGSNINAYTNVDETVYNISNVPTEKASVMDSCVLILHDWSGSLTLAGEEIDAERGVIKEEWRTRNSPDRRLRNKLANVTFHDSQYAIRDVIGDMNVIDNSPYSAIRSFYKKWYRPDLQSVIIVGDFDTDEMEARVRRILSKIPKSVNPATRIEYPVGNNEELLYGWATDEEAQYVQYNLMIKHAPTARFERNEEYLRRDMMISLFYSVMQERLANIQQKPESPFVRGLIGYYNFTRTMDAYYLGGTKPAHTDLLSSMKALMIENERVRRYGITSTELDRAKIKMMKRYEEASKNVKEVSNDSYARSLKDHYLVGEPKLGAELELEMAKKLLPGVAANEVSALIAKANTDNNVVITVKGPKEVDFEYPTREQMVALIAEVKASEVTPFVDRIVTAPLIANEPVAGTITSKKSLDGVEATEYTLSNGAKVVVYPTDKNENEILFRAYSPGGRSLLTTEDLVSASEVVSVADMSGLGAHSVEDLRQLLVGKQVGLQVQIGQFEEGLRGSSTPEDIETLFKLIYLTFESPRFDEASYETVMAQRKLQMKNSANNLQKVFFDTVAVANASGQLDRRPLQTLDNLDQVSFDKMEKIYKDRIKDAGDFVFVFVGAVNEEELLVLIEKYIGSIQDSGRREEWKDEGIRPYGNGYEKSFSRKMEVEKQTNYVKYFGESKYSRESELVMTIAKNILSQRYFETVREQEGGSYGVGVYGNFSQEPVDNYSMVMYFDCNPDKADRLLEIIEEELDKLIENGPSKENYQKAIEGMTKTREQSLEQNSTLMSGIMGQYSQGLNSALPENYEEILEGMTLKKFTKSFSKLMKNRDMMKVVMQPE